jgi:hypothetical protein
MTIGGSIALIIIGAILAFAVTLDVAGIDINTIGFILMAGGTIGLVVGLLLWQRRRYRVVEQPGGYESTTRTIRR